MRRVDRRDPLEGSGLLTRRHRRRRTQTKRGVLFGVPNQAAKDPDPFRR